MAIDTVSIDRTLEQLAVKEANRFNAYYISYLSNQTNIDEVNDYLLMKARFGALIVRVETICPNDHIDQQFELDLKNGLEKSLPNYEIECRFCDDEESQYIPDPANTNVVFYFTPATIESFKKKHQMHLMAVI